MEELLAQVIEEVSVLAADRRRKEPRSVKRPFDTTTAPSGAPQGVVSNASGGTTVHGHDAMLAMFAGRVRPAAPAEGEGVTGG